MLLSIKKTYSFHMKNGFQNKSLQLKLKIIIINTRFSKNGINKRGLHKQYQYITFIWQSKGIKAAILQTQGICIQVMLHREIRGIATDKGIQTSYYNVISFQQHSCKKTTELNEAWYHMDE